MIEGPKFVIAVTPKKYYKEVTQCTIEYYFVRNNKETNNKERINFRSSRGTYLMSIHGSRCIHFFSNVVPIIGGVCGILALLAVLAFVAYRYRKLYLATRYVIDLSFY